MTTLRIGPVLGVTLALALASCQPAREPFPEPVGEGPMTIRITSPVFAPGGDMPVRFTCDAEDFSPPLEWTGVPAEAKSLALICDDPDAPSGDWVHWVIYGLPPSSTGLPEGVPATAEAVENARQGTNDFRRTGYGGPCPPPGKPHRYYFRLYALDVAPDLEPGATKRDLLRAMEGHVLAHGELMGRYERKR